MDGQTCSGVVDRFPGVRLGLVLLVLLLSPVGCARDRGLRAGPEQGTDTATVGHDLKNAPRGQALPPPGLGVDLARYDAPD